MTQEQQPPPIENPSLQELLDQATTAERIERNYPRALSIYQTILARIPDPFEPLYHEIRLRTREKLGSLLFRLGKAQDALAQFEAYRNESLNPLERIKGLSLIGNLLSLLGRLEEAVRVLNEALLLAEDQDITVQAPAHLSMGISLYESGKLTEALASFEKAMAGFQITDDREQMLRVCNWQGLAYYQLGQTTQAIKSFQEGLQLARQVGVRATAILLNNLGEVHQDLYDVEQALEYHTEGLKLAESTKLAGNITDLARNVGIDLVYLGQVEEGLAHLYRALTLSDESGRDKAKLRALYALSRAEAIAGNLAMAKTHGQVLLELAREKNARVYEAEALYALGVCASLSGDAMQANEYWQQASFLAHETEQRMLLWQIHAKMAAAAPADMADVHYRIAAEVIEQLIQPIADKRLREKFLSNPLVKTVLTHVS